MKRLTTVVLAGLVLGLMFGVWVSAETLLSVHFIDVKQGDAILIDYGQYELLIDGGGGEACSLYLSGFVNGPLECIVATHMDADHIGGLDEVLALFDVLDVWTNGTTNSDFEHAVATEGASVNVARRGGQILLGELVLNILHPVNPYNDNNGSIVLELEYGGTRILFTGDIKGEAEAELVHAGMIDDIDILKVAHHGSNGSSRMWFLEVALPEVAIYSASGAQYDHPSPKALRRLHCPPIGAVIYGTNKHGTIVVDVTTAGYTVRPSNDLIQLSVECQTKSLTCFPICIDYIFYVGRVSRTEADEYVQISNQGSEAVDITGWILKDISEGYPIFTFPLRVLQPGDVIRVYTNEDHAEWGGYSFQSKKVVWNNTDPDTVALYNQDNQEVCRKSY